MSNFKDKDEFYTAIKQNISIVDYAASLGYHVIRKGRYFSLKEHDSVMIDPDKNCFWRNSTHASGSVIDFALEFTSMSMTEVLGEFEKILDGKIGFQTSYYSELLPEFKMGKGSFELPQKVDHVRNIYAYLMNRKIDKRVFAEFMDRHILYQDIRNNCVFVAYDEKRVPVYAMLRGTNTYKTFKGDVPDADYSYMFRVEYDSDKLIVCESPIEVMSLMSLFLRSGRTIKKYDWCSLSGISKREALYKKAEQGTYKEIILALNNDIRGIQAAKEIQGKLEEEYHIKVCLWLPEKKDWNDQLCSK